MECQNIALGTYRLKDEKCIEIVKLGLQYGYKQIDTAELYKNHKEVAQGIKLSKIPREEIFIVSKIFNNNITKLKIAETVDTIKKELEINDIDLILLHNPVKNYEKAWEELIKCQIQQNIKYIGTSNFELEHLDKIINNTRINPYLNQIELSLWNPPNEKIINYHKNANIIVQAHSIYTNNNKINDVNLDELANNYKINKYKLIHKFISDQQIPIVIGSSNINNIKLNYDWIFETSIFDNIIDKNIFKKFDCNYRIYNKFKNIK